MQLRAREIDWRYLAAADEQGSDAFKFFGRGEVLFGACALRKRQRQTVVRLNHCLDQRTARDVGAGMCRGQQRAILCQRRAQLAGNIKVARHIHERFVFADRIVGDEALRSRLVGIQTQRRRSIDVTQRRAYLRQKGGLRLSYIFGRDALVQRRLLKARRLRVRESQGFVQRQRVRRLRGLRR